MRHWEGKGKKKSITKAEGELAAVLKAKSIIGGLLRLYGNLITDGKRSRQNRQKLKQIDKPQIEKDRRSEGEGKGVRSQIQIELKLSLYSADSDRAILDCCCWCLLSSSVRMH